MIYILFFIIGTILTSFCNLVIYRLPKNEDIVFKRSYCVHCQHKLNWFDLIPIVSYLMTRGKCRYCHHDISLSHLVWELLGGMFCMIVFIVFGNTVNTFLFIIIGMNLFVVAMIDYQTMDIYVSTLITLLLLSIVYSYVNHYQLLDIIIGILILSIPMYLLILIIPNSFGLGDVLLMMVSGVMLGWQGNLLAFIIATIIGGIVSSKNVLFKRQSRKDVIAFGPYLSIGILISLLYGPMIIRNYLNLLII